MPLTRNERYPYVIIRWMAAVYGEKRIVFINEGESVYDDGSFIVADRCPIENSCLTSQCKERIIRLIQTLSKDTKLSMCLVLAEDQAVYIEPNGSITTSNNPPSGGIQLNDVKAISRGDN